MPISKANKAKYPPNWPAISYRIRFLRAGGRCEFTDEDGCRCEARHGMSHPITGSRVVLTCAHMDHDPANCADDNLKAACQRCHNRYDVEHRKANRKATVGRKRTEDRLNAESIGIDLKALKRLGGMERLKAMPEDARALILAQKAGKGPRNPRVGGLKARGYRTRKRRMDTQKERFDAADPIQVAQPTAVG